MRALKIIRLSFLCLMMTMVWSVASTPMLSIAGDANELNSTYKLDEAHGGYTITISDEFNVIPGGDLDMEDLVGDVTIRGGSGKKVIVTQEFFFDVDTEKEAEAAFKRYRARVSFSGNRVEVIGQDRNRRRYVETSYQATVPNRFNVNVETMGGNIKLDVLEGRTDLETLGGDVDVSDMVGDLRVETAGGDVTVKEIAGEASLKTAGGDVELRGARNGPFKLKTAGGDIIVRSVEGDVDAATSGGDVKARQITGDVDLSTSGGDIILEKIEGKSHSASTSGGDVEAQNVMGDLELKTSGGEVTATLIAGDLYGRTSGGDIEIDDVSGDADISTSGGNLEIARVMGRLSGKTSGGDIEALVIGNGMLKESIRLSSSGGDITIKLPRDVKATVDAEIRTQDRFENYTIRSDFKLKIDDEVESYHRVITGTGDINGGGPLIELTTSEGNISIEKR